MASDLEFLDEVTAFLETETIVPGETPRKSFGEEGFPQLFGNDAAPSWVTATSPIDADPLPKDSELESNKSSSDGGSSSTKKRNTLSVTADIRRQKYRQKMKGERDELRQTADELSKHVQELIEARRGSKTTPRTDLVLSKAFWRRVATQQCDQRLRVEAEREKLLAIVNSQGAYIESMRVALREYPKFSSTLVRITSSDDNGNGDRIDDLKWLRLKSSVSSVSTLYTTYLQEVDNCYTRIDRAFQDAEMESLPVGVVDASYRYKTNGDVEYFQHRNRLLQPFDFAETCRVMWELATLPHRQSDRQVYQGVSDPENTVGVQFRLQKTLPSG